MPQDKVKEVYGLISDLGYFKDENEFKSYVSDPKRRKEAFDLIADEGYFKDENEFNSYFSEVKPTEPPIQKTGTFEPRNKVAEMLNQPTSQDIQREKRGISKAPTEVVSGTKAPQVGVKPETIKKEIETAQKQKVKREEESAFIGVKQEAEAKGVNTLDLFPEKSDNIANYLNEESKVEYNFLKALENYGREVNELTARTEATGNPQTQADLQKAKFNKYKAQVELEKFTKQRNAKIDEQINYVSNIVQGLQQEGGREEEIAGLQKDIAKLQGEKENYLKNPDQKIISVFSANKQEMDEFKVPGNTPRERVKNYALIVNKQIEEIDEKIKTKFPGQPLEEPSFTGGYDAATRSPELEDLWRRKMELIPKMQALSQVALVDRMPQKDTGGMFGAMSDALKKELLPDKFTQQNLKDMDIQDVGALIEQNQIAMGLADEIVNQSALKETQRQQAPTEAFSSEWFGGILGNSLAMGPAMGLGAGASLAANVPKLVRAARIASTTTKYGKFLVPTLKATERGIEYAMAKPFLQQESLQDEATFMSGFLGAAIAKPIEKTLSAKNMQAIIGKLFGDKAPVVANKIMQLGNRVASGLGEYGEEVGNTVGSIVGDYLETKDFQELKKSLNEQFGSLEPNMELFVGSVVMGFFMGSGTGIGDAAINKSKEVYAAMTPEQKKTADEILKQFKDDLETSEVNAKRQEIAEGDAPPKVEEVTEVDLQNKQAAIDVIQSPTATIKEKAEAAKIVRDIDAKEREVVITEKALEQGPLAEGDVVKEEVMETPKEEVGELVVTDEVKDIKDEVTDEKIGERKYQSFSIDFEDGARAIGTIENGVASISGINAPKAEGSVIEPKRGTKTYERVISKLKESGVKTISVKLQSTDSEKAIDKLVEKGILTNPRDIRGGSFNQRPTTFDISTEQPTTLKEVTPTTPILKEEDMIEDKIEGKIEEEPKEVEGGKVEGVKVYRGQQKGQQGSWFTTSKEFASKFANAVKGSKKSDGEIIEQTISGNVLELPLNVTDYIDISGEFDKIVGLGESEIRQAIATTDERLSKSKTIRIHSLLENKGLQKLLSEKGYDFVKAKESLNKDTEIETYLKIDNGEATIAKENEITNDDDFVKDKEGKPKILYHGTGVDFKDFDQDKSSAATRFGKGISFSEAKGVANQYSLERLGLEDKAENDSKAIVKEAKIKIKYPFNEIEPNDINTPQAQKLKKILVDRYNANPIFVENILKGNINEDSFKAISRIVFDETKDEKIFMFTGNPEKTRKILEEAGYDSIIAQYNDTVEYFVFDKKNIEMVGQNKVETPKKEPLKEQKPKTEAKPKTEKPKAFVSKSGKQVVGMNANGEMEVYDKETGKPSSATTRRKVLKEYIESTDFNKGERSVDPPEEFREKGYSDETIDLFYIDNSNNPLEVVEVFLKQEPVANRPLSAFAAGDKTDIIANAIDFPKIKRSGFTRFGDRNLINASMAKSYFASKADDGIGIDVIAQSMTDEYGIEITPNDLVEFMVSFPNGQETALRMGDNKAAQAARDRFKELTGLNLTKDIAKQIVSQQSKISKQQEQQFLQKEYERIEQLESEYWATYEESPINGTEDGGAIKAEQPITSAEGEGVSGVESLQEKVAQAEKDLKSAQNKLSKARQSQAEIGKEQQLDIMGNKPADNKLFGADVSIAEKQIKKLQDEVDAAKENLDKAKAELDNVVPANQMQMGLEGESETEVINSIFPNTVIKQKVYHGSENKIKGEFKKLNQNIDGFFFSNDIDNAKTYGNEITEAYVNIQNPLRINAKGLKFTDDIPVTVIASYPGEKPYETTIKMPMDEIVSMVKNGKKPNQLVEIKDREKYDGVIFENIIDPALSSRRDLPQDTIVVFDNKQIIKVEDAVKETTSETQKLVSKLRNLKIDTKGKTFDATLGLPVAVYNSAIEIVAKAIEGGAKLGNAIAKAMKYIDSQMGDKQWNKGFFAKEMNVRYSVTLPNGSNVEVERDTTKETAEVINGWYQPIEQKIIDTKQDSLPANKWAEILKSKEDEDLWTGVREFLQDKGKETVTKKELSDFIKENRVEIVEVVKGSQTDLLNIKRQEYENQKNEWINSRVQELQDEDADMSLDDAKNVATNQYYEEEVDPDREVDIYEDQDDTKFAQYQLEGEKENYVEKLVILPSKASSLNDVSIDLYGIPFSQLKVEFPNSFESKESRVQEVRSRTIESGEGGKQFKSSHFEEPNIVVHLRMNTRTDAEGNKVLFLEEVQSDWGQKGKKEGFGGGKYTNEDSKRAKELNDKFDTEGLSQTEMTELTNLKRKEKGIILTPTAPFVTDTNAWAKLGLKVALKEAVNQNVDKIAWTTGEQQNDRYSLEKVADEVRYKKNSDGTYEIVAYKAGENVSEDKALREDKLEATLGKDVAKRVIDGVGEDIEGKKSLTGENLKVGGKGMKGFYGSPKEGSLGIIGNLAKSLFKQEPKTTKIVTQEQDVKLSNESFDMSEAPKELQDLVEKYSEGIEDGDYAELQKFKNEAKLIGYEVNYDLDGVVTSFKRVSGKPTLSTQYSIDVTPELKLSVNNGLPLFGSEISTEQALKDTIARELNKSANELGSFNIGSTKLWLSMAKLMGLYSKKGVTKFGDFVKATGYKATSALKSLWDAIRNRKQTTISKSVKNAKLRTLNARVLFYEALIGVDPLADGQTQLDALKDTIATYKTLAIHANKNEVQDVINAVDALSDLYIELSADLNTVKAKIASQAANGQPTFELKDKLTIAGNAIKSFADDFKWQEKVQNEIEKVKGTLPDDMNPYMQKDISIGRVENTISEMMQKIFGKRYGQLKTNKKGEKSLFERAAQDKISQEDLDFFLYVQHAKERNARVEAIKIAEKTEAIQDAQDRLADLATQDQTNPSVKAQTTMAKQALSEAQSMAIVADGSGMSNEEADRFMQEFEKSGKVPKLEQYAKEYRETVIKPMIDMMEEGNLLDADQAEMLRTGMDKKTGVKFDYYVPLKVEKEALEQSQGTVASASPTLLNPIKSIKGTSKYDYVKRISPIAQSISDFQAAAKSVEDNKTAQSLYKLVKENPNKDIWEIVSPTFMPNADGVPINQTAQDVKDSSIPVKIDGKLKYIKLNHKGLRDAWLRKPTDVDWFYKIILNTFRTYNNFKRKVLTQYSPEFALVNLIRDVQDAVFNSAGVDIPFLGKQIIGNLPKANATAAKAIYGNLDPDSDMGKTLDLYLASGGKISWANYNAIEDVQKEIDQMTAKFSDDKSLGYYGKNAFNKVVATIGAFNETVEIGTRLATFKALIDNGITPQKAASISKNMTVNFNKRGTATPLLNAAYLFSNAGIQSIYVGAKGLAKSQKARRYAAYTMLTGLAVPFIQQMMIAALSDSDEEEREYKQLLTKEEQLDFLVIPIGKGEFLRIPKSYGMTRLFLNSGQEFGSAMIDGKIAEHSVNTASTLLSVIDPITGNANNKISAAFPTALRPLIEVLAINKDYKNAPIYPEDRFGPESADYLKFYPKTADFYKNFAENMYFKSGSNIDVSPETLEYIVNDFFSGVFRTGENFLVAGTQLSQGKEVDPNKIPFKSKFIVDMSEQDWRYTKDFWTIYNNSEKVLYQKEEIEEVINLVKKLDAKRAKDGGPKAVKEFREKINTIKKGQEKLKEQKEAFEKKQQK